LKLGIVSPVSESGKAAVGWSDKVAHSAMHIAGSAAPPRADRLIRRRLYTSIGHTPM
jgi:hypothetical protein